MSPLYVCKHMIVEQRVQKIERGITTNSSLLAKTDYLNHRQFIYNTNAAYQLENANRRFAVIQKAAFANMQHCRYACVRPSARLKSERLKLVLAHGWPNSKTQSGVLLFFFLVGWHMIHTENQAWNEFWWISRILGRELKIIKQISFTIIHMIYSFVYSYKHIFHGRNFW